MREIYSSLDFNMSKVIRTANWLLLVLTVQAFLMPALPAMAQNVIAVIEQTRGTVEVTRDGSRETVKKGFGLSEKDVVHTADKSAAGLKFSDGALVALGAGTDFALDSYDYDKAADRGSFESSIRRGSLSVRSGRIAKKGRDRMRIRTPATILGVRGTRFMVKVDPDR